MINLENGHKPMDNCPVCKKLSTLKCSNCVKVFYCSVEHQRQDWKRHKHNCRPFEVINKKKNPTFFFFPQNNSTTSDFCKQNQKKIYFYALKLGCE